MSYLGWHQEASVKEHLQDYHLRKAREPDYRHYKGLHDRIMTRIRSILQQDQKCLYLEYTGSVQVGTEVEFDVMVVMDGAGIVAREATGFPGYLELKAGDSFSWGKDERYRRFLDDNKRIIPAKVIDMFHGTLTKIVENLENDVKLRRHGPAVQMDVFEQGRIVYSVDVVPTFDIRSRGQLCVAKPFKGECVASDDQPGVQPLWRISKSMEEKERMAMIDVNNGCRKQVLRILKTLVKSNPQFRSLTSFHMKTAVLQVSRDGKEWNPANMLLRLIDVMVWLEGKLRAQRMPHFFIPEVNLLSSMPPQALTNMADRIRKIHQKRDDFLQTFRLT